MSYSIMLRGEVPLKGGDYGKKYQKLQCEEIEFKDNNKVILKRVKDIEEIEEWIEEASNIDIFEGLADMLVLERPHGNEEITVYTRVQGYYLE